MPVENSVLLRKFSRTISNQFVPKNAGGKPFCCYKSYPALFPSGVDKKTPVEHPFAAAKVIPHYFQVVWTQKRRWKTLLLCTIVAYSIFWPTIVFLTGFLNHRNWWTTQYWCRSSVSSENTYHRLRLGRLLRGLDFSRFDVDFFLRSCSFLTDKSRKSAINFSVSIHRKPLLQRRIVVRVLSWCIIRRKLIWSCPSFENWPIFGFGATSDFLGQIIATW